MKRRAAGARRFEADLDAGIGALFRRCPTLCGFTVQDAQSELFVSELSVYPLHGPEAYSELSGEILVALAQLVDECPGIRELLRERTFARILH